LKALVEGAAIRLTRLVETANLLESSAKMVVRREVGVVELQRVLVGDYPGAIADDARTRSRLRRTEAGSPRSTVLL
jgi:hypothetical protein